MATVASDALKFASYLSYLTRLDSGVLLAWMASENRIDHTRWGGDDGAAGVPENWLNIAIAGPVYRAGDRNVWQDPSSAATATNEFLHDKFKTWPSGNIDVQGILRSASQSPTAQLQAIQASGWIGGVPGQGSYSNLFAAYQLYKGQAPNPTPPGTGSGIGGAGTTANNVGKFYVNTTSGVDTDYWTALNNWAQQAQWYVFTDGEIIYIADGFILGQQVPVAIIGPVVGTQEPDTRIQAFSGTLDNTSFQYFQTHKRRSRYQRKTEMAKVQSPTQLLIDYTCAIDAIRAGDLVQLIGAGPFDGPWLVGNCLRSVFNIFSELTLVPTMVPIKPGTTVAQSRSSQTVPIGSPKGYTNPFSSIKGLVPERVDMGVDYGGSGPIRAIGSGKIESIFIPGWGPPNGIAPGAFICWTLESGTYAGKMVYFAEGIQAQVKKGQHVNTGDVIGQMVGGIECGWARSVGTPLGAGQGGFPTAAGASFSRFLKSLGAPPGTMSGTPSGSNPPGYP